MARPLPKTSGARIGIPVPKRINTTQSLLPRVSIATVAEPPVLTLSPTTGNQPSEAQGTTPSAHVGLWTRSDGGAYHLAMIWLRRAARTVEVAGNTACKLS